MKKALRLFSAFLVLTCFALTATAQPDAPTIVLPERERATVIDDILEDRFTNLLPTLMRREGIDMWVIISREYNRNGEP